MEQKKKKKKGKGEKKKKKKNIKKNTYHYKINTFIASLRI